MADEQIPGYNKAAVTRRGVDEFLGLCKGIIADGSVCEPEAKFLLNWLEGNALVQTEFPVSHIYPRLAEMLSGGTLSEADAQALLVLLQSATGEQGQQAAVNMSTGSAFDDPQPRLNIAGEVYCLTGDFAFGSRKAVKSYIETLGGTVSDKTVLASGCILVVGCKGSDAWLHSTHGSKIKDAVDKRAKGCPVCIVSEEHFINQALNAERRLKERQAYEAERQVNTRNAYRDVVQGKYDEEPVRETRLEIEPGEERDRIIAAIKSLKEEQGKFGIAFDETPISFLGRTFCLTGTFALGERATLEESIVACGGAVAKSVVKRGCVLVVGSDSSPRWKTSSRGQKIIDALEAREQGKPVQIVFEARFIAELFGLMESYEVE